MTDGQASISAAILARYAADAAGRVPGVLGLTGRRGAKIAEGRVEMHIEVEWGAVIPDVGTQVRESVREYLGRMADLHPADVEVVVDRIGPIA